MASPSSLSLLGLKQLSIYLVDCLKTPADLRPAVRPEPEAENPANIEDIHVRDEAEKSQQEARHHLCEHCGKSFSNSSNVFRHQRCHCKAKRDNPSVLMQKELSVCLLDRMKAPGLNGPVVNLEEVDEQSDFENPQRMNQELEELQPSPGRADGTPLATQKAVVPNSEVSESLGEASLCNSEERQEETFCRDVVQHEADAVPAAGEKNQQGGAATARHPRCEQSFTKRSNVFRHQRRHCKAKRGKQTKQETYLCHKCSTTFRTKRYFRLHVCIRIENSENLKGAEISEEAPRRERRHACDQCDKRFYSFPILQQHLLTHTGEKSYSCEVCGKQFGRKGTLKSHMLIHTGEKPFTCDQCGKTCARRGDLNIHMLSHSEERPYGCSRCPKRFKQRTKLNQHEASHTGDEPYLCNFCPKQFRVQELLAAHLYTHSEERPFKCTVCPETFDNGSDLKKHQMIHKPHSCSHCGKSFQLLQHLTSHECDHVGEKPYKCDKGEKSFTELKALRVHQSIEKPAHCLRCRKSFVELTGHKCCEAPEKQHSCAQCGKRFSQAGNLKKHQLVHTGEKPYDCKECGKQFSDKSNLSRHMRTHTDEKPFECPVCKKRFRLPHNLTSHRLTHGDTD